VFGSRRVTGRLTPGRFVVSTLTSAALLLAIVPASVFTATAAQANPDGETTSPPAYEVDGGVSGSFENKSQKTKTKETDCTTNCTRGAATVTPVPDYSFSKTIWFDDTATYYASAPAGGSFQFNFDSLYILSKTSIPKADKNFGYNGNAIPAPGSGSFVTRATISVTGTTFTERQAVWTDVVNPDTGTIIQRLTDYDEWQWSEYDYRVSVSTMQAPTLKNRRCVSYGEYQLNGPLGKDGQPLTSVLEGGTMTRTPNDDGVISHEGKAVSIRSALGETMAFPKSDVPSLAAVWANCLPNQNTNFAEQRTETISDLGRYEAPTTLWGAPVEWLSISGSAGDIARVYPFLVNTSQATGRYLYTGGIAYFILMVNPAAKMAPFASYYKIICANGTQANKRSEFLTVNAKSYDGFAAQPWNDAGVDYYSWDCSAGTTLPPNQINSSSLLQCDTYGGNYGSIVENKPAAPLLSSSIIIDGEPVALEYKNNAYQIPTTADAIRFEWQRIRFNTQDGTNILNSPIVKNPVFEFAYQLDPASSPMLKNTDVNNPSQPYHGFVDSTPNDISAAEMPLDKKWEPGKFYEFEQLPYTYSFKDYTYTTIIDLLPHTFRSETRVTGSYSYPCGTYTYQSGTETYQCGGGYSVVSSGGATYYWWVNGGRGGWACPGGWWLSGTTCFTNTYIPPQYCSRPTFATGTNYCSAPTYGTFSVKNAPPVGWFDNGSQYQRNTQIKNPAPEGYTDNGISYQTTNPPPAGYSLQGDSYVSNELKNTSGQFGGIEFNNYRPWPSIKGDISLKTCEINPADYGINGGAKSTIRCGDNVTDNARAAYFRYFMSSSATVKGWTVTPWTKVTADVLMRHTEISGIQLQTDGSLSTVASETENWVRESFACPAQPVTVNIERVAG